MELNLDRGTNWFSFPSLDEAIAHLASLDVNRPEQETRGAAGVANGGADAYESNTGSNRRLRNQSATQPRHGFEVAPT
jgi:hypothetical protein